MVPLTPLSSPHPSLFPPAQLIELKGELLARGIYTGRMKERAQFFKALYTMLEEEYAKMMEEGTQPLTFSAWAQAGHSNNPEWYTLVELQAELMTESRKGHVDLVALCLQRGADLNFQNDHGDSALMVACANGNESLAKFLVEQGANVKLVNKHGQSCTDLASLNMHHRIVSILRNLWKVRRKRLVGTVHKNKMAVGSAGESALDKLKVPQRLRLDPIKGATADPGRERGAMQRFDV